MSVETTSSNVRVITHTAQLNNIIDKNVEAALTAIGLFVVAEAKDNCPVDTGNLRGSITFEVSKDEATVTIGSPVEYAGWVENGTSKQKGQPYIKPAINNNIDAIERLAQSYIGVDVHE